MMHPVVEELPALLLYIAAAANVFAFVQMGIDKWLAVRGAWRISEIQLIAPVLVGGIVGVLLGMKAFRHKTSKLEFKIKLASGFAIFAIAAYMMLNRS